MTETVLHHLCYYCYICKPRIIVIENFFSQLGANTQMISCFPGIKKIFLVPVNIDELLCEEFKFLRTFFHVQVQFSLMYGFLRTSIVFSDVQLSLMRTLRIDKYTRLTI